MPDIYEQHAKAFARVEAHVILKDDEHVATIAFKFPADGAGRLYAYVHWLGLEMVRGFASGGGYDKRSAACSSAAHKMNGGRPASVSLPASWLHDFVQALLPDGGNYWGNKPSQLVEG